MIAVQDDVAKFIGSPDALYNGLDEEQQLALYHDLKTQSALCVLLSLLVTPYSLSFTSTYLCILSGRY